MFDENSFSSESFDQTSWYFDLLAGLVVFVTAGSVTLTPQQVQWGISHYIRAATAELQVVGQQVLAGGSKLIAIATGAVALATQNVATRLGFIMRVATAALTTTSESFWAVQRHFVRLATGALEVSATAGRALLDTVKEKYTSIFVKTVDAETTVMTDDKPVRVKHGRR
jgi:hypothetical protein